MKTPLLLAVAVCLIGCAAKERPVSPDLLAALRQREVGPGTCVRLSQGRVPTYEDIHHLVTHRVPGPLVVDYLRSTGAPFVFTRRQIDDLATAGASPELLAFLRAQQLR